MILGDAHAQDTRSVGLVGMNAWSNAIAGDVNADVVADVIADRRQQWRLTTHSCLLCLYYAYLVHAHRRVSS